jgi:hypothetical protein
MTYRGVRMVRQVGRYQRSIQKPYIEEGQIVQ